MAAQVFVDTGAWYALQAPDDRWHADAARALEELLRGGRSLVTSNHVVGETYSLLTRTHNARVALRFVDSLGQSARLEVIHVDAATEKAAYDVLRRFSDQAFSFVDATSFALMRRRRIRSAFAFDHHFSVAGFNRVPLDEAP